MELDPALQRTAIDESRIMVTPNHSPRKAQPAQRAGSTQADGFTHGRPADRLPHPLDEVVEAAIEKLPMEVRLYPDVFAWKVTDAVLRSLRGEA